MLKIPEIYNEFTHPGVPGTINDQPSETDASFADEVNINSIMAKAERANAYYITAQSPVFGDFSEVKGFQDAQNRLIAIKEEFDALSPQIRKRFDNDPGKLMDFIHNSGSIKEAIELGLVEQEKVPEIPLSTSIADAIVAAQKLAVNNAAGPVVS